MAADEDTDLERMLKDVTELVKAWRLRGFDQVDIVAALTASGITAQRGAGFGREDMIEMIDRELGYHTHVRPAAKA